MDARFVRRFEPNIDRMSVVSRSAAGKSSRKTTTILINPSIFERPNISGKLSYVEIAQCQERLWGDRERCWVQVWIFDGLVGESEVARYVNSSRRQQSTKGQRVRTCRFSSTEETHLRDAKEGLCPCREEEAQDGPQQSFAATSV